MKDIRMLFRSGYGGQGANIEITTDNGKTWYIVDNQELERVFLGELDKKGFEITKTNKQKYHRLKIKA